MSTTMGSQNSHSTKQCPTNGKQCAVAVKSNCNGCSTTVNGVSLHELYYPEPLVASKRGIDLLKAPGMNKGCAFTLEERQQLGLHGLLPPSVVSQDQQVKRELSRVRDQPTPLARYCYLDSLKARNERLFYRLVTENVTELLPIVYTPTVGEACQKYGYIMGQPKGIYITINDNTISKMYKILSNWPNQDVRAIVVTDGERILGLGDLGAQGMGISVGKLSLYVALGGVKPEWCLPVTLDVGTDTKELLEDPYYSGLRRNRVRGEEYDNLVETFMMACVKKFGRKVLIQFEDFAKGNAYRLLDHFAPRYCMFNDDVQGTASVVVAGLLGCTKISGKKISDTKYMFLGGGAAATGIADLCVLQMEEEGLTSEEAHERIYLINTGGLITKSRIAKLEPRLVPYAKDMAEEKNLLKIVKAVKPDALIGVSTVANSFTHEVLRFMGETHKHPIIFPLSNPTSKAECTAEDAYRLTDGRALFASGSPFDPVTLANGGRVYNPGQCNNSYIFPGVALGVIVFEVSTIKNGLFLTAAKVLAECVSSEYLKEGRVYPRLEDSRENSIKIAVAVGEESYRDGTARLYPKPADLEMYVRAQTYNLNYDDLVSRTYNYPEKDLEQVM